MVKKINERTKKIITEWTMMTNKEMTEEFSEQDLEGRRGAGDPCLDLRIIKGETYKLRNVAQNDHEPKGDKNER